METAPLKSFATWARRELITQVSARLTAVLAPSSPERVENQRAVAMLERDIVAAGGGAKGKDVVAEKVAYTWFNRIIALRFMDANGYTGIGVVSPAHGQQVGQPEILADAKRGYIDPAVLASKRTLDTIIGLLDGTRPSTDAQGEAYTILLAEYCRYWNRSLPFMFEREGDYTELLIPANLLAADSILTRATATLTKDVCREVEVIGWLYQFYISERKDEVFAGFNKGKKAGAAEIPAATQLFTPHWIVRYLVENSVGRLWMLNHPASRIVDKMDYYIAPVGEEIDFLSIASPEELTVIDPACGSGHMLTYAFDLLYAIYEEEGYASSEIPELILTHNLYGTEIDPRAGALAAFALTMKARDRQRTFFSKGVAPSVCVLESISFRPDEVDVLRAEQGDCATDEAFWNQFEHADTFGSLIQPGRWQLMTLATALERTDTSGDLLYQDAVEKAHRLARQVKLLSDTYAVVVANPPYMGSKQMNALLSQFMKDEYPTGKADLMTAFMLRAQGLTRRGGAWAMINLPSWMSLKSFAGLRLDLINVQRIVSMVHLGRGIFGSDFGSVAFVVDNVPGRAARGVYRRLFEQHVDVRSVTTIEALFRDASYNRFVVSQADFAAIPGTPIVYWLSEKMRAAFAHGTPLSEIAPPRNGLSTSDDAAFTRAWWEVSYSRTEFNRTSSDTSASGAKWFPLDKGGEFRRWYGNQTFLVNWENDGEAIKKFIVERYPYLNGNPGIKVRSTEMYFKPHVSFSSVSSGDPAFREYPGGTVFGGSAKAMFYETAAGVQELLGTLNSRLITAMLEAVAPTLNFEARQVAGLPIIPEASEGTSDRVDSLVAVSKSDWDSDETSWDFEVNPLVQLGQARNVEAR